MRRWHVPQSPAPRRHMYRRRGLLQRELRRRRLPRHRSVRRDMTLRRLFWLVALGAACSSEPERNEPDEPETVAMLSPAEHLVRVSMALRGTRPSPEELREVRDNPEAVEQLVDQYLLDQGFGEMI